VKPRNDCLLLTGATGFIGGATACRLLHDERVGKPVLPAQMADDD
jgi:nucleoside-diphosphate-sugar epimerase